VFRVFEAISMVITIPDIYVYFHCLLLRLLKERNIFPLAQSRYIYSNTDQAKLKTSFSSNNRLNYSTKRVFTLLFLHFIPRYVEQMSVKIQTFSLKYIHNCTHILCIVYYIYIQFDCTPSILAQ